MTIASRLICRFIILKIMFLNAGCVKTVLEKKEFNADLTEKLDMVPVFLPECRATEQYMLYVHEMPCPHLKVRGGKNNAE